MSQDTRSLFDELGDILKPCALMNHLDASTLKLYSMLDYAIEHGGDDVFGFIEEHEDFYTEDEYNELLGLLTFLADNTHL